MSPELRTELHKKFIQARMNETRSNFATIRKDVFEPEEIPELKKHFTVNEVSKAAFPYFVFSKI